MVDTEKKQTMSIKSINALVLLTKNAKIAYSEGLIMEIC